MRLAFMGTSGFAVPSLERLVSAGHDVRAVFTQPDRPSGRGQRPKAPPVKEASQSLGLDLHQPETLKSPDFRALIEAAAPEIIVVVAYGKILPPWLIDLPVHGAVNLHASLLPKYRGAAPINWAIANGETRTGVCTMKMDRGLDTGPVYRCLDTFIGLEETAPELSIRLAAMGSNLVEETIQAVASGAIESRPQDESQATLAPRLTRKDGYIRPEEPAQSVHDKIRGFLPWPGVVVGFRNARCRFLKSRRTSITADAAPPGATALEGGRLMMRCGDGWLEIVSLQPENRRPVSGLDFANGVRLQPGEPFTCAGEFRS